MLPNIKSTSQFLRQSDERRASNTPIQGSAADIMKRIQNAAYELIGTNPLYRNNVALVAQVHDEQIFELPEDLNIIKPFVEAIKAEMEKEPIPGFKTPLQADASIAYRWGEKMSYEKFLDSKKGVE